MAITHLMVTESHRRTRLEIIASILHACRRSGVKKTHLLYHCNLSFSQLEKYLRFILEAKLVAVENDGSHRLFKISGKGENFLKSYESLKALIE